MQTKTGIKILEQWKISDEEKEWILNELDRNNISFLRVYYVLEMIINEIEGQAGNKNWINNKYTKIFLDNEYINKIGFISREIDKGRVFPLTLLNLMNTRVYCINNMKEVRNLNEIDEKDILLAHLLMIAIDEDVPKDLITDIIRTQPFFTLGEEHDTYKHLVMMNFLYYKGRKKYSYIYYLSYLLITSMNYDIFESESKIGNLFSLFLSVDSDKLTKWEQVYKNLIIIKDKKILFPLGKISPIFLSNYVKDILARIEKKEKNISPNDFISNVWNRGFEEIIYRKIKKGISENRDYFISENGIRKKIWMSGKKLERSWSKKDAIFTPDLIFKKGRSMFIFDIKCIGFDEKFLETSQGFKYTIEKHIGSVKKFIDLHKKVKHGEKKELNNATYTFVNDIVVADTFFGDVFVKMIRDEYHRKYMEHIPSWLKLKFVPFSKLVYWVGSKELDTSKLFKAGVDYPTMTPSSGLLTEEMQKYFNDQEEMKLISKLKTHP